MSSAHPLRWLDECSACGATRGVEGWGGAHTLHIFRSFSMTTSESGCLHIMGDVTKVYLNALQKKYEESILYLKEKVVKSVLLWDPMASSSLSKPQPFDVRAFHLKVECTRFILQGKKTWFTLFCDHTISSFMTQFVPPWLKMALSTCGFHLQLLHWKQRNVCGQDYRGQVAEGIWHPFKAWFWRYVWRLHIFWGVSRPRCWGYSQMRGANAVAFPSRSSGICGEAGSWQNRK